MKSDELRAMQAPLKEKYKETPNAALITLRSQGRIGEGITCKIETGKALVEAGLHEATGGTGLSVCSGDMLLEALVACAGVTLMQLPLRLAYTLRSGTVRAEGDIDFRGTLGDFERCDGFFRSKAYGCSLIWIPTPRKSSLNPLKN